MEITENKLLCLFLCVLLLFSLSACGGPAAPEQNDPPAQADPPSMTVPERRPDPEPVPEPEPESAPEPEPDPIAELMESMTIWEKLLQLFLVAPEALTGEAAVTDGEELSAALAETPVGGLVLFRQNLVDREQVKKLLEDAQNASELGLFIGVDEEGGVVNRLMGTLGTTRVNSMFYYKDMGPEKARENAQTIGTDISDSGFKLTEAEPASVFDGGFPPVRRQSP